MQDSIVYIVDDDVGLVKSMGWMLKTIGLTSKSYSDPNQFIDDMDNLQHGCILLDVRMPKMSGMELLKLIRTRQINLPVIVVTAYGDVSMAVQAIKQGAIDFIPKPFNEQVLLELIQKALLSKQEPMPSTISFEEIAKLYTTLSQRENQVLNLIVEGESNKQIAQELGIAISTVEMHRCKIMQKMQVTNVAQLIKKVLLLKL